MHTAIILAILILGARAQENLLNPALVAEQSSVGWNGLPGRAIDGNTDGNYFAESCTHSEGTEGNWWKVTLPGVSKVNTVRIYNRVDCCQDRISGAEVFVGETSCGVVEYAGEQIIDVNCAGAEGDTVTIMQDSNYLTLCEVQVIEQKSLVNSDSVATSNSVGWDGVPERAIDGNTSGNYWDGSCFHSEGNQGDNFLNVNLGGVRTVNSVKIYNRADCCADRINGAQVFVGETLCGAVEYDESVSVYSIDCGDASGDSVEVRLSDEYLTICELEVLGY